MKKLTFLFLITLLPLMASAQTVKIQGINYYMNSANKTASVVSNSSYSENILTIPEIVTYEGVTYNVTKIGQYAFRNCSGLTYVNIPSSVTKIEDGAFIGCSSLTKVELNSIAFAPYSSSYTVEKIFGSQVKEYIIGDSVTSISDYAFYYCSGLTSVTISNSVKTIADYAFYGCSSLTSVIIGKNIDSIRDNAFGSCKELLDVYCYARKAPSTDKKAFASSDIQFAVLHVQELSVNGYKTTSPWSGFGNVVALTDNDPTPKIEPVPDKKCATPTIIFENGKLSFSCETEGAEIHYEYGSKGVGSEMDAPQTVIFTVYATKEGYEDSDVATKEVEVSGGTAGIKGDVNEDGSVNGTDIQEVINIIVHAE